jgi:hypothetical protein
MNQQEAVARPCNITDEKVKERGRDNHPWKTACTITFSAQTSWSCEAKRNHADTARKSAGALIKCTNMNKTTN